jgi:hypothetical protein
MRQETGSNPNSADKKVSIQVKLGGRSFSVDNISLKVGVEQVEFIIDTPRVTLTPREEVSAENAAQILQLAGKPCRHNEQCILSDPQSEIIAIIAIDSNALATIKGRWGSRALFTSPLLDMRHCEETCLTIDASDKVCYLRLFKDGLQRAEAYEIGCIEDVLYYTREWLGNADTPIYIKGERTIAKLLNKYYKQVICE